MVLGCLSMMVYVAGLCVAVGAAVAVFNPQCEAREKYAGLYGFVVVLLVGHGLVVCGVGVMVCCWMAWVCCVGSAIVAHEAIEEEEGKFHVRARATSGV